VPVADVRADPAHAFAIDFTSAPILREQCDDLLDIPDVIADASDHRRGARVGVREAHVGPREVVYMKWRETAAARSTLRHNALVNRRIPKSKHSVHTYRPPILALIGGSSRRLVLKKKLLLAMVSCAMVHYAMVHRYGAPIVGA